MQILTIGEESPVDGWATIDYFHVLCHNGSPLFAPQTASNDFWLNVVTNLGMYENNIGRYYSRQLQKYVHLPYPAAPPGEPEPAAPADNSHWQRDTRWEWPPAWEEGRSSSSSQWQSDRYGPSRSGGQQRQSDWWSRPSYDAYHMYQ